MLRERRERERERERVESKMKPRFFYAEGAGKIGSAVGIERYLMVDCFSG